MQLEEMKKLVLDALDDLKAVDTVTIDVSQQTDVTDLMVITSGTSSRHVKALANNVLTEAKQAGSPALGSEGEESGEWVLVDLGDVVVHIMMPETRQLYDLEKLWTFVDRGEGSSQA